ncbi:hypothetical protein EON65_55215 [archaeon]|nr:MAG: hypothetical protein EON65_55215 [archaeon]
MKDYVENREQVLEQIMNHYEVSRNKAKKLMLRLMFTGTVQGWKIEEKVEKKANLEYLNNFTRELLSVAQTLRPENETLYESCRDAKQKKGSAEKRQRVEDNSVLGSLLATYMQTVELQIVNTVLDEIIDKTSLAMVKGVTLPVATYEFDGIKLMIKNIEEYGGVEKVLNFLNKVTREKTGFSMIWEEKEVETKYDLEEYMTKEGEIDWDFEESQGCMNECETLSTVHPNFMLEIRVVTCGAVAFALAAGRS